MLTRNETAFGTAQKRETQSASLAKVVHHRHPPFSFHLHLPRLTFPLLQQAVMLRRQALRTFARYGSPMRSSRCFATAAPPSPNDAFANGTNTYYVEEMYRHWREDPKSVHASWDAYFSGMDKGLPSHQAFQPPPTFLPAPVGGAPTLNAGNGAKLDDHLKASKNRVTCPAHVLNVVSRFNFWSEHTKSVGTMSPTWTP